MTVYFIGAGPGDPELITLKGHRLISSIPNCFYAGSLVPEAVVASAPEGAQVVDTAPLHLGEIMELIKSAHARGEDVARVHSGDPSLYGAIAEQIRCLDDFGIAYEVIPGVPAYAAAAAKLGKELTIPEICQTVILTRTSMKSTSMPQGEDLETLGRSGATLAIHLSVRNIPEIQRKLIPLYGEECPVVVAYRVGWPDESFLFGTLYDIREKVRKAKITRTALILVGRALGKSNFRDSVLYDADHSHILRVSRSQSGEAGST